ncbi:GNAT family N-acetyltransferase [Bifidobacterium aemilianum]|uniref:GNAT family N-acetyltransferase n=1 Tax=Bifidobacterium aemilianum TaxID=2493120 RepID=A0A366KBZ1_9BIFI|nr:GNAT family N-acetyltransferase [Bifidobacterium aemilianum]RBP98643.1 GNAT family N-acetyltransferase [Bifidobacterium aemilianum]
MAGIARPSQQTVKQTGQITQEQAGGHSELPVIYRPMAWEDLQDLVVGYDQTWGQYALADDRDQGLLVARYFVLHYLERASQGEVAYQGDKFLGVILTRVVGQPPAFPQAKGELAQTRQFLEANDKGRQLIQVTDYWHRIESEMEDQISANERDQAEVELFMVAAAARGRGVGGGLWGRLHARLEGQGVERFYLHTDSTCDVSFYRHKGLEQSISRMAADHGEDRAAIGEDLDDLYIYEDTISPGQGQSASSAEGTPGHDDRQA